MDTDEVPNTPLLKFTHFTKEARKVIHQNREKLTNKCIDQFHNKDIPYASKGYCLQFNSWYEIRQCATEDGMEYYVMLNKVPIIILLQIRQSNTIHPAEVWICGDDAVAYLKETCAKTEPIHTDWCSCCNYLREGRIEAINDRRYFECYTCVYTTQIGLFDVYKDRKEECPWCVNVRIANEKADRKRKRAADKARRLNMTPEEEVADYLFQQTMEDARTQSLIEFQQKKEEEAQKQMADMQAYHDAMLTQSAPAILVEDDPDDWYYDVESYESHESTNDSEVEYDSDNSDESDQ